MSTPILTDVIKSLAEGNMPGDGDIKHAFTEILSGQAQPEQIGAFLMGLRLVGETAAVLTSGASVMRQHARRISIDGLVLDTCGTGGLNWVSLNTSTASAIVVAACGGRVAKHGNRSVPPKTGSADVLEALGVELDIDEMTFRRCVEEAGVGFMFARSHHSAMRHVAPVRQTLGIRTVFNLLGPLTNPANANHQIVGVFAPEWVRPMADALRALGTTRSWVVHGMDGVDELSVSGVTRIAETSASGVLEFELTPEDAGLSRSPLSALRGGTPADNAAAIRDLLEGRPGPFRDMVCLNAAAGLNLLGLVTTLQDGIAAAQAALEDGRALKTLDGLIRASRGGVA